MDGGSAQPRADIAAFPLEFTGTGGEYFRVWIVNLLLTIVTLGFYTPLARRRTAQYFYGHTMVADSPLEFTAQTKRMLVGFVLFVALYAAFNRPVAGPRCVVRAPAASAWRPATCAAARRRRRAPPLALIHI